MRVTAQNLKQGGIYIGTASTKNSNTHSDCTRCVEIKNVAKRACDQCFIFVRFNNFALTAGFYWSYTLLLKSPVLMRSCNSQPYTLDDDECMYICLKVQICKRNASLDFPTLNCMPDLMLIKTITPLNTVTCFAYEWNVVVAALLLLFSLEALFACRYVECA